MVRKRRRSRLPASIQEELVRQFVAGATARAAAELAGVNRHTATLCKILATTMGMEMRSSERKIGPSRRVEAGRRGVFIGRVRKASAMR